MKEDIKLWTFSCGVVMVIVFSCFVKSLFVRVQSSSTFCDWQSLDCAPMFDVSSIKCTWTKQHQFTDVMHCNECLKETRSVLWQNGPPHCTVSQGNVEFICKTFQRIPCKSLHRASLELGLPCSCIIFCTRDLNCMLTGISWSRR
jgi:hypothetical protein